MDALLPPRLGALLALDADPAFADRLRRVYEAAARAISKLGELELVKYEDSPIEASADLSLWEELAPVVMSTISDVNALLAEVAINFPPGELVVDPIQNEIDLLIQAASSELKQMVTDFGMRVRDPSVVGDRWNLIGELQQFRFQFRNRIGSMVFETAALLGECKRAEVEPGYSEALKGSLTLRATTADLRRLMRARIQKVGESGQWDVFAQAEQIEKELGAFGRTAAWNALRAQDKRSVLEFRSKLAQVRQPGVDKLHLLQVLEPFVEFVDGFQDINQRDMLLVHDRELLAELGVQLERAVQAEQPRDKLQPFMEALAMAAPLYGRDPEFDIFLRKARKAEHSEATIVADVEQFLVSLANINVY